MDRYRVQAQRLAPEDHSEYSEEEVTSVRDSLKGWFEVLAFISFFSMLGSCGSEGFLHPITLTLIAINIVFDVLSAGGGFARKATDWVIPFVLKKKKSNTPLPLTRTEEVAEIDVDTSSLLLIPEEGESSDSALIDFDFNTKTRVFQSQGKGGESYAVLRIKGADKEVYISTEVPSDKIDSKVPHTSVSSWEIPYTFWVDIREKAEALQKTQVTFPEEVSQEIQVIEYQKIEA